VITTSLIAGEMYIWTDEHGGKHITDTPPPDKAKTAERMSYARDNPREIEAYKAKRRAEQDAAAVEQQARIYRNQQEEAMGKLADKERYKQETRDQTRQGALSLLRDMQRGGASVDDAQRRTLDILERKIERERHAP
jgi:hypothetical protein